MEYTLKAPKEVLEAFEAIGVVLEKLGHAASGEVSWKRDGQVFRVVHQEGINHRLLSRVAGNALGIGLVIRINIQTIEFGSTGIIMHGWAADSDWMEDIILRQPDAEDVVADVAFAGQTLLAHGEASSIPV